MVTQGVTIKAAPIVSYDAYDANDAFLITILIEVFYDCIGNYYVCIIQIK